MQAAEVHPIFSLIVLLPALGAILIGLGGFLFPALRKAEGAIGALGTAMVAIPFGLVLYAFFNYHGPIEFGLFGANDSIEWMFGGGLDLNFVYRLDELSLTMAMIVTGVGALIHIYSIGYMHGDRGYYKFFLYLNLFIFSMLNLILGNNLVVLFLGWEGVGACSYFLIGFWYEDMAKAAAAQKAFVANRIGDFAMIIAMMMIYKTVNTLTIGGPEGIIANIHLFEGTTEAWLVPLLLFCAATGKSAQIPLFVWLPDAMAGPTPVSALIHAATMVTSGIYLIARMGGLFIEAQGVMLVVGIVGAMTALLAALIAIAQNDIKKVLAYSTVSQLGFMFMALGAGAFTTAIFHVMTHAFFKACLFLGSGSVIHAMDHMHTVEDGQDIRTMGNLRKYMPSTHWTFFISTLAISGIPLLSGFFSKDEIMTMNFLNGVSGNTVYFIIWGVGMFTAFLTAFYMTRVYFLTFRGEERFPDTKKPHESSGLMTFPLWVLAGLAVVGGYLGLPAIIGHGKFHMLNGWLGGGGGHGGGHDAHSMGAVTMDHMHKIEEHASMGLEIGLILFSILVAVAGVMISWNLYKKHGLAGDEIVKRRAGGMYKTMQNKFYVDELYQKVFINPFMALGRNVIMAFDKLVIDGIVNGLGNFILFLGDGLKMLQTGLVGQYALLLVIGVVAILTYLVIL
jgi:NADH-quinone oxidoreductase subunit L